jgi:hypothetical protein
VKGPRYWQQTISAGPAGKGALAALYSSGALPVQLQRWALSYIQDPSGVRGLLSQAFDDVRSLACSCARALFMQTDVCRSTRRLVLFAFAVPTM